MAGLRVQCRAGMPMTMLMALMTVMIARRAWWSLPHASGGWQVHACACGVCWNQLPGAFSMCRVWLTGLMGVQASRYVRKEDGSWPVRCARLPRVLCDLLHSVQCMAWQLDGAITAEFSKGCAQAVCCG